MNRYGGHINEEILNELHGRRGMQIYKEMSENDDVIGAIIFAIKMLARQAKWRIEAASEESVDMAAAAFVESCLDDLNITWTDLISEILSFVVYGFSVCEIVYKRRMGHTRDVRTDSKYNDKLTGWQKLAFRAQESLYEWEFDSHDNLTAFIQRPAPNYERIRIPAEKILIFRTESHKDNPEGRSVLRNAYRSWFFKKRLQELEGIGIERDLAGFPILLAPEGFDIWSEENAGVLKMCNDFVRNVRRDSVEGMTLPHGWELKLLSTGGKRQFDTNAIITRYDTRISQTVLADFIMLGQNSVGSFALSSNKTHLFSMAIGVYLDIIAETFNRKAIPLLMEINGKEFAKISGLPRLRHSDIETQDLEKLGTFLKQMVTLGLIESDENLESYLRMQASLPPKI